MRAIYIKNTCEPVCDIIPGKDKSVKKLRTAAKSAERIFLAADPDREGEAICQHLKETLDGKDRKSTRLNSSHLVISYAVFCLKKKKKNNEIYIERHQLLEHNALTLR